MEATVFIAAVIVFVVAAYGDVRRRQIPNAIALALAALGVLHLSLEGDPVAAGWTIAAAAAVLAIGFGLFSFGLVGGGDAKLLAAATLLVGYRDLPSFLLVMSLCGGVVALALIGYRKLRPWLSVVAAAALAHQRFGAWCARRPRLASMLVSSTGGGSGRAVVPYGVAIAAAGIVILSLQLTFGR